MKKYELIDPKKIEKKIDGTGQVTVFFTSEKLLFSTFELGPGCSLKKDFHPNGDEGYYVLKGELTVILPELNVERKIRVGEVFYIKSGVVHIALNNGKEDTKVIAAIAPKSD